MSEKAAITLAGVLEYLTREILELAIQVCKKDQRQRVNQSHIKSAYEMDEDFKSLFSKMGIQTSLYQKKNKRASADAQPTQKTVTGRKN